MQGTLVPQMNVHPRDGAFHEAPIGQFKVRPENEARLGKSKENARSLHPVELHDPDYDLRIAFCNTCFSCWVYNLVLALRLGGWFGILGS